jgi:hypothetical protein
MSLGRADVRTALEKYEIRPTGLKTVVSAGLRLRFAAWRLAMVGGKARISELHCWVVGLELELVVYVIAGLAPLRSVKV